MQPTFWRALGGEFHHVFPRSFRRLVSRASCRPRSPSPMRPEVPKTWVDKDTGHRVWRLSDEPNSGGFYFNVNAYTPDHKSMIYTAPDGIHVLDLDTRKTRLLVPNPPACDRLPHPPIPAPFAEPEPAVIPMPSSPATRPTASSSPNLIPPPTPPRSTKPTPTPEPSANSPTCRPKSASSASTPTRPSPPAPTSKATPPARSTAPTLHQRQASP